MKLMSFASIPVLPSVDNIYRTLGYSTHKTIISDVLQKDLNKYIEEARGIIELKGVCLRVDVSKITNREISLEGNIIFKSVDLVTFLKESVQVLLSGATAGQKIMDSIAKKTAEKDLTRAVVYNAVAGEMVDDALTWISQYRHQHIRRENLALDTRRFSAGYGDFDIEYQKIFWECLKLKELGVALTENYFLIPEKSVTAISGIRLKLGDA